MIARGLAPVSKKLFAFRHPPQGHSQGPCADGAFANNFLFF